MQQFTKLGTTKVLNERMCKEDLGIVYKAFQDKETGQMDFTCFVEAVLAMMLKREYGTYSEARIVAKFGQENFTECL